MYFIIALTAFDGSISLAL